MNEVPAPGAWRETVCTPPGRAGAGRVRTGGYAMTTEVLTIDTPDRFDLAVDRAAAVLCAGGLVAMPTETVYGLAGCGLDPDAVRRIFLVKGRPPNNPLILHVHEQSMAMACVRHWPEPAGRLAAAFWPGPLTLVLFRNERVPDVVTAGGPTVALRCPRHAFMRAVIARCGFPLAVPSANLSGRLSPTTAEHVYKQLAGRIELIIDGGPTELGIESTVVDLTVSPPRVLRPGLIHEGVLSAVVGQPVLAGPEGAQADAPAKSPGLMRTHYAPRTPLVLVDTPGAPEPADPADPYTRVASGLGMALADCYVLAHAHIPPAARVRGLSVMPSDPAGYARVLYGELHRADESGALLILVERPPSGPAWAGVLDRLARAAHTGATRQTIQSRTSAGQNQIGANVI